MVKDEISLIEEKLVQLSVKSSLLVPIGNLSLICSVWTKKSYTPDSFKAQIKSIWKTTKKFEIQVVGKNLFLISSDSEDDLDMIIEECDKKDHMHAVGSTFEGVIRSEIKGDFCQLKTQIDALKPLRRGSYGAPYASFWEETWNLLRRLGNEKKIPWLVCGDYNELLYSFEKVCGVPREERRMKAFRKALDDCQLGDMGTRGITSLGNKEICPRLILGSC
ncbi:hypothetical protein Golob_024146 [Gossypium lobatum]|uniref:Reverse transcriptase n=1 Tax=Gossypium lobatum TaxID=34289 RepID=A0A7J8NKY9_9ROSI|nr:hypothetical protein [Gossypium lobatum]